MIGPDASSLTLEQANEALLMLNKCYLILKALPLVALRDEIVRTRSSAAVAGDKAPSFDPAALDRQEKRLEIIIAAVAALRAVERSTPAALVS